MRQQTMNDERLSELQEKYKDRNLLEELAWGAYADHSGYTSKQNGEFLNWLCLMAYKALKERLLVISTELSAEQLNQKGAYELAVQALEKISQLEARLQSATLENNKYIDKYTISYLHQDSITKPDTKI